MQPADVRSLFAYRAFDVEIRAKAASDKAQATDVAAAVWPALASAGLSVAELRRLQQLWQRLSFVDFGRVYPNYLVHPLRVAGSLAMHPRVLDANLVVIALCHNLRELSQDAVLADEIADIQADFLADRERRVLDRLYTDRSRERDPEYLRRYYEGIAAEGAHLVVLKGLDKLDNELSYAYDFVDPYHHDVVTRFVVPLVQSVDGKLATYLDGLARYVQTPEAIERFRPAQAVRR